MNKLTKVKNKVIATVISSMAVANMMAMTAYAEGDVSGAIQSTWNDAKSQIKSIVDNVVFPVLDVVLVFQQHIHTDILPGNHIRQSG